jgi:phosphate transport system substrate-binding protein
MMSNRRITTISSIMVPAALIFGLMLGCARQQTTGPSPSGEGKGPAAAAKQTIRQVGSNTILPIAEKWRQGFNAKHPDVEINISGEGSGVGFRSLISKSAEICDASREIKQEEKDQAKAAGVNPVEHTVAYDGIAVIVNPSNPLKEISVQDLSDIYSGKVTKWDGVGAKGLGEVQLMSRDSSSGTYESFKDMVITLGGKEKDRDYAPQTLKQASTQAVLSMVAQTKGGVGYVGLGYVDKTVKVLNVVPLAGGKAVTPTPETVLNGTYPISRKLYCYTDGEPSGIVKEYLDWIMGSEGQALVKETGFVPLKG